MRASKQLTTNEPAAAAKDSLALITARVLRDVMGSRGKHVAELDDAIKAEEGETAQTHEHSED